MQPCANVIKIYAYAHKTYGNMHGDFILLLEHGGTNLQEFAKVLLKSDQIIDIFIQIFKGLDYIHNFGEDKLIHRDIKPANIFVRVDGNKLEVKIGDMGQIRNTGLKSTKTYRGAQGTVPFMAIEVLQKYIEIQGTTRAFDASIYNQSADVYAGGLSLLYTIMTIVAFHDYTSLTQISKKIPCLPEYFPIKFHNLVSTMIHPESSKRPTASEVRTALEKFKTNPEDMKKFEEAFRRLKAYNKYMEEFENGDIMNYDYIMIEQAIRI